MTEQVSFKPSDVPLDATEDRRLFCKFHYQGVLTVLIPILFAPVLLGQPVVACRFIYITICVYLYFILDIIPRGAVALAYVVFGPIAGIADSAKVCVSYYTDVLLMVFGFCILANMMKTSRLSEHLGFLVIRCVGTNIILLQLFLAAGAFILAFLVNPTAAAAFWIEVSQAVLTEYEESDILKMYSEEERYEPGGAEYPSRPAVGIYLTLCYTATLAGAVSPFVNPNGNIVDAFPGKLKIQHLLLVMVVPVILGICVMILWIQVLFLGLLGGSVKRELKQLAADKTDFQKTVADRKLDLGPWSVHSILALVMILISFIAMHTRSPRLYHGWGDIPTHGAGLSVASLGLVFTLSAIPANYLFCRYYACRKPRAEGAVTTLISWKSVNKYTPWGDLLLLGAAFCCVFCGIESGLYKAIADAVSKPSRGGFLQFLYGACYGTLFTILSPATELCRRALPVMATAGNNFALPFATALHNQFLLPTSSPANTIVAGLGNVRPFLFLLAGIVPTLFMMIMITASTWIFYDNAIS